MSVGSSRRVSLVAFVALVVFLGVLGLRTVRTPPASQPPESAADVPRATPELAQRAMDRLRHFRDGKAGFRLSLGSDDVTALLRHGLPGVLPMGLTNPLVTFEGERVRVEARLATEHFVARKALVAVLGVLPDTVPVEVVGRLEDGDDFLRFVVHEARAGLVPLPSAALAAIASELARPSGSAFAATGEVPSLAMRRPIGISLAEVVDGRLVLRRDEPKVDRAVDGSEDP